MTAMDEADSSFTVPEPDPGSQIAHPEDEYRQAWEEASEYVKSLPPDELRELQENRERGDRWAEDVVAGRRDPLDGMPEA